MVVQARTHPAQLTRENRTNRDEEGRGCPSRVDWRRVDGVASMAPMPSDVAATTQRRWRRDESAAAETRRHVSPRRSPSYNYESNYIRRS